MDEGSIKSKGMTHKGIVGQLTNRPSEAAHPCERDLMLMGYRDEYAEPLRQQARARSVARALVAMHALVGRDGKS